MKKIICLLAFLVVNTSISLGLCYLKQDTIKIKLIYIINFYDKPSIITSNNFINPSDWEYIHFLRGEQYNELTKFLKVTQIGIIQIKRGVTLFNLRDILKKYHISQEDRGFKIMYDDDLINFPETLLASIKQIVDVKIIKKPSGNFIDIIGSDYNEIKKLKQEKKNGGLIVD